MSASVVTLRNPQGHALHCMLEEPRGGARTAEVAAVLLCPGVKTRVGPHRLNRKLAQPFLERGIPVLRVDFRGLGDSEGNWADDSLEHIYRQTELGHCAGDARSALDWLESRLGARRFIVGGLCGAAMTALHLAREDARMCALFAIGLPARLVGPPIVTRAELRSHWSRYLSKLARPAAWLRFLSLQSDYRLMWSSVTARLENGQSSLQQAIAADLNPHLLPAMFELLRTGRMALILFGENDPRRWDFEEKFLEPWSASLEPYRRQIAYSIVPGANHVLGTPAAVAEANRRTAAWLEDLVAAQVLGQARESTEAMLHSGGGAAAIGLHRAALECGVKPTRASAQRDQQPCSTNESSSSIRLRK